MKKVGFLMLFIGFISFMLGIYISTHWMITGTILGVVGGIVMGGSTYFFIGTRKNSHS